MGGRRRSSCVHRSQVNRTLVNGAAVTDRVRPRRRRRDPAGRSGRPAAASFESDGRRTDALRGAGRRCIGALRADATQVGVAPAPSSPVTHRSARPPPPAPDARLETSSAAPPAPAPAPSAPPAPAPARGPGIGSTSSSRPRRCSCGRSRSAEPPPDPSSVNIAIIGAGPGRDRGGRARGRTRKVDAHALRAVGARRYDRQVPEGQVRDGRAAAAPAAGGPQDDLRGGRPRAGPRVVGHGRPGRRHERLVEATEILSIGGEKGAFRIEVRGPTGAQTVGATHIVLWRSGCRATCGSSACRATTSPGSLTSWDDPKAYEDKRVIVVGVGDAGIENAIALAENGNEVTIVNRRDEIDRAKPMNKAAIEAKIKSGEIAYLTNASADRFESRRGHLQDEGRLRGSRRVRPRDRPARRDAAALLPRGDGHLRSRAPTRRRSRTSPTNTNRTSRASTWSARWSAIR